MIELYSPNMLKTYERCPKKFYLKYVKNISMPFDDEIFEFGKNIHALAAYFLKGQNIENMERSLSLKEAEVWNYLKSLKYFQYDVIDVEYDLSVKIGGKFFGGRLDALVKCEDTYYILDYKTGSAPKNAKCDFQTIVYMLAVSEFYKTNNVKFVYLDLKNCEEVSIDLNEGLKGEYIKKLEDILAKIENVDWMNSLHKKPECCCEYSLICY